MKHKQNLKRGSKKKSLKNRRREEKILLYKKFLTLLAKREKVLLPKRREGKMSIEIKSLPLSTRAKNVVNRLNIKRFEELVNFTKSDLLLTRGCGQKTFSEIELLMKNLRLTLRQ